MIALHPTTRKIELSDFRADGTGRLIPMRLSAAFFIHGGVTGCLAISTKNELWVACHCLILGHFLHEADRFNCCNRGPRLGSAVEGRCNFNRSISRSVNYPKTNFCLQIP